MIPPVPREDFDAIRKILVQHRGKANAITQPQLAVVVGFFLSDGEPDVRRVQQVLQHYRRDFPLPLVSGGKGVYLAANAGEVNEWFDAMNSRHAAETETMCAVRDVAIAAGMIQTAPWRVAAPGKTEHQSEMPIILTDRNHAEVEP
jgi:hypothetical protein